MARADILNVLYAQHKTPLEYSFDSLVAPPLIAFMSFEDVQALYKIATSVRYSGNVKKKYKDIDEVMNRRGFKRFHAGTNRVVYTHDECNTIVVKVAIDKVGLGDNPAEFKNQQLLKPFVTKVFEVSPCGTVGLFERVDPITSREEFESVSGDVFDLITKCIIGKYILEDIGSQYFMNWSIRKGFGVCLLDFPYVFELDGNKIFCNRPLTEGTKFPVCDGEIDYDSGFNNLVCRRCGKQYIAKDLEVKNDSKLIILKGGKIKMKVVLKKGTGKNAKILCDSTMTSTDVIIRPEVKKKRIKNKVITPILTGIHIDDINNRTKGISILEENTQPEWMTAIINTPLEEVKKDSLPEKSNDIIKNVLNNTRFSKKEDTVIKEEKDTGILHPVDPIKEVTNEVTINLDTPSYDDDLGDDDLGDDAFEYDDYMSNRQRNQNKTSTKRKVSKDNMSGY